MRNVFSSNHSGFAEGSQGVSAFTAPLRAFTVLALGLFLPACSSTGNAPVTSGAPDPWAAVQEIDRGADVRVGVDCALDRDHDACAARAQPEGHDPMLRIVTGKYVEADGESLLVRPIWNEAELMHVDRGMVQTVDVVRGDSTFLGTVIGAGIGSSAVAISRLLTYSSDFGINQRLMFLWMWGVPAGVLGYFIDRAMSRGKFTVVRIYQRHLGAPERVRHPLYSRS